MKTKILELVENPLELNEANLWVLDKSKKFAYSDGVESESYLKSVLNKASDLSFNSYELESYIKDWNSEYHLSRKRAQLLKGFNFDRTKKVLEVGCGCGAITRFLGESFNSVTAIEGSIVRAEIARMRTRELDNVSIICAPFQEIVFKEKFDMIFCIGVFEYSNMFVSGLDPYDRILEYFKEMLNPDGEVVIAIENQFGLKYFSSSTEDHSGVKFDGLEGYTRFGNKNAKTFGYTELTRRLKRHFQGIEFYFPFPDYKMPSCVVSQDFIEKANVGEMIGCFDKQTAYIDQDKQIFDEKLVWLEIDKNGMLDFFSNSFLVLASKSKDIKSRLNGLGMIFSDGRCEQFQTTTTFKSKLDGTIVANKVINSGETTVQADFIQLNECESVWINELSLHTQLLKVAKNTSLTLSEFLEPLRVWVEFLRSAASNEGELPGKYLDCIWKNSFIKDSNCNFIDQEWTWKGKVTLERLFIKSFFEFLSDVATLSDLNPLFKVNSKTKLITQAGKELGISLNNSHFADFIEVESKIALSVYCQRNIESWKKYMRLELNNNALAKAITTNMVLIKKYKAKIQRVISRVSSKR